MSAVGFQTLMRAMTAAILVVAVPNGCGARTELLAGMSAAAGSSSVSVSTSSSSGPVSIPPSCQPGGPGMTNCGPGGSGSESCCTSLEVPGGTYYRTYGDINYFDGGFATATDGGPTGEADPATVSGFRLDKYLVTVGRFRQYVNYVTSNTGAPPANGSGIHAYLNGGRGLANSAVAGPDETGWDATDWNAYIATGTGAASTWNTNLSCEAAYVTWTSAAGGQETLPINCVNWYEAYAFCIWDGGFLPSEAEWEYVAAGGSQQLEYPWGSTDPGPANQYAIYSGYYTANPTFIAPVGTATLVAGYWGQLDMAGEVFEWTLDWYGTYVNPCTNCAYLTTASSRVVRGGDFFNNPGYLLPPYRTPDGPGDGDNIFGFRCARTP